MMENNKKKHNHKVQKCNICGLPSEVTYTEHNENGQAIQVKHFPPCLGHYHLHPRLWNMSSTLQDEGSQKFLRVITFDDYEKLRVKRQRNKQ